MYQALYQDIGNVPGIGPALAKRLAGRGVVCLGDLLLHLPRDYVDDSQITPIRMLSEHVAARVQGRILARRAKGYGRNRQVNLSMIDDSGVQLELSFFHSGFMMSDARLAEGQEITVRGIAQRWGSRISMAHPEWMSLSRFQPGWQPVYPSLAGLGGRRLGGLIDKALTMLPVSGSSPLDALMPGGMSFCEAIRRVHQPLAAPDISALNRLKQEELLVYLQLMRQQKQAAVVTTAAWQSETMSAQLMASLPFPLTEAQQQVWQQIRTDFAAGQRMHRLVQGDVGAGKTWVAALAMVMAVEHGTQAALMAPTEVLARQHAETLYMILQPLKLQVEVLTGSTKAAERRRILAALHDGTCHLLVGTHALISEGVVYQKLGLAIVDEQHRFGVRQRWALADKGKAVHVLGMTATPIPRSLALAMYGDMELSVMRGMPPGRKPVETRVIHAASIQKLLAGMQRILEQNGRIYWIVPRIDEEEDDASVDQRAAVLQKHFGGEKVLGLHGRMKPRDKLAALGGFAGGESRILVSTTVIEVGVNVPEARLIVIEQAEQYGLAQLHQLRGRVGRSSEQGYCILLAGEKVSESSMQRLRMMTDCHDGLELAEADLAMRGAGDAIGVRQSGEAGFRTVDPAADAALIRELYEHMPDVSELSAEVVRFWRPAAESVD